MRFLFSLIILFFSLSATSQPKIQWLEKHHDFGVFAEDTGLVTCSFRYTNVGDEPLVIISAQANCGCTTPQYQREALAPGDTASIAVSYNPAGRPGRFKKKIKLRVNDETVSPTLYVSGVVIASAETIALNYPVDAGSLQLNNTIAMIGEVTNKRGKSAFINAYNITADTLKPTITNVPEYLSVSFSPKEVAPGEQVAIGIYFNSFGCNKWGIVSDTITLLPNGNDSIKVNLDVTANITEDFSRLTPGERLNAPVLSLESDKVDFGEFSRDSGVITQRLAIKNTGKSDLILRRVYTQDPGITIKVNKTKLKKGKTAEIIIMVDPAQLPGELFNARLIIIANDPDNPESIVRLVGLIK